MMQRIKVDLFSVAGQMHYGSKQGKIETLNYTLSHERGSERSERASERVSGASERANGRASGPVLTSGFLTNLNHSAVVCHGKGSNKIMSRFQRIFKSRS